MEALVSMGCQVIFDAGLASSIVARVALGLAIHAEL